MNWDKDFFDKLEDLYIWVLGDVMLDRYLYGRIERISPEAPVPVLELRSVENRVGGAANVAFNLQQLGCKTSLFGVSGKDSQGDLLNSLLDEAGLYHSGVIALNDRPTTVKTRVIAGSQHVLRVDEEVKTDIDTSAENGLMAAIGKEFQKRRPDAIILQDYNKGVLTARVIGAVLEMASEHDVIVTVDPKFHNFFSFRGVDIFKPNLKELEACVPFPFDKSLAGLTRASAYVRERLGNKVTCITLGEDGLFLSDGIAEQIYPARRRDVVDVCGAGDAVISVLTAGYVLGLANDQLAALSNSAGGGVCEHVGVTPVSRYMLSKELAIASFM